MTKIPATTKQTSPKAPMLAFTSLLLVLAVLFLLNFRLFVTAGPSMYPTYTEGTVLLAMRSYTTPKAGEVIFLKHQGIYCLKRVAYVAGDDVSTGSYEGYWGSNIVPEGYVFVLGDNLDQSSDSRDPDFGLIPIECIWGKPLEQRQKGA